MLRQLMIYYIKVYSLPRSQAMRFDSKHQSHCLSCIFSQKIQFAFVDCSSICKQCLCIYKGSNTHGIANLPCVFCLLGCSPNPCKHHGTVMAVHSYRVLKERFAETRSLHRHDADRKGFGHSPTSILNLDLKNTIQKLQVGTNLPCLPQQCVLFVRSLKFLDWRKTPC